MTSSSTTFNGDVTITGELSTAHLQGNGAGIHDINGNSFGTAGVPNSVAVFDADSELESETLLSIARGGTGIDTSALSGYMYISSGAWSCQADPEVRMDIDSFSRTAYGHVETLTGEDATILSIDMTPNIVHHKSLAICRLRVTCGEKTGSGATYNHHQFYHVYMLEWNSTSDFGMRTSLLEYDNGTLADVSIACLVKPSTPIVTVDCYNFTASTVVWSATLDYSKFSCHD